MTHKHKEAGQAIILVAFLMIGMIAMVGLAVDGGGMYFLQRDLQNAVDSAVMAATYAKCVNGDITFAAKEAAARNGFRDGEDGVIIAVNENFSPPADPSGAYVQVSITAPKDAYFIQVVYEPPLNVTASGVGYCKESPVNTSGRALFASCEGEGPGVDIAGSDVNVYGGIHSNSDVKGSPGTDVEGTLSASGDTSRYGGNVYPGPAKDGVKVAAYPYTWELNQFDNAGAEYPQRIITAWGDDHYMYFNKAIVLNVSDIQASLAFESGKDISDIPDPTQEPILIYATGSVTIKGPSGDDKVYYLTIVTPGRIEFIGNVSDVSFINAGESGARGTWGADVGEVANGMDSLFLFSGVDNTDEKTCKPVGTAHAAVSYSANFTYWEGIIYAPYGDVIINMARNKADSVGAVWARAVSYSVAGGSLRFDASILPPDPPSIGLAK